MSLPPELTRILAQVVTAQDQLAPTIARLKRLENDLIACLEAAAYDELEDHELTHVQLAVFTFDFSPEDRQREIEALWAELMEIDDE